jgi:hypothetical protein
VIGLALVLLALAGGAPVQHETMSNGGVTATVSYVRMGRQWSSRYYVRLVVQRGGVKAFDAHVPPYSRRWPYDEPLRVGLGGSSIQVVDLDGDGEPEILLRFWTGGAHCCVWTRIYRWNGSTYASSTRWWGDFAYSIENLGPGATVELLSGDDRFAYAFACFACSSFPVRIWSYRAGRLVDVTRRYPALIADDAAQQFEWFREALRDPAASTRGLLAAWVADECNLGRSTYAFRWLRSHPKAYTGRDYGDGAGPTAQEYRTALRRFLRRTGYLR